MSVVGALCGWCVHVLHASMCASTVCHVTGCLSSLTAGNTLLIEQRINITQGKKSLTEFGEGLSHWLQLIPAGPDNNATVYQAMSVNGCFQPLR